MNNAGIMSDEAEFIKAILQDNHFIIGALKKLENYHYLNVYYFFDLHNYF